MFGTACAGRRGPSPATSGRAHIRSRAQRILLGVRPPTSGRLGADNPQMDDLIARAADLVATAGPVGAFTGAGVSTEPGLPDLRSPTRLWARYAPGDFPYQGFNEADEGRRRYWTVGAALYRIVRAARPNAAHQALVELDALGLLDCVITQNIDNLHQQAGTPAEKVIEL